jgi:histidine triad (HIT) family protein
MDQNCLFCKIIQNQIPSPRLYEDDQFICIKDIQPHAPIHLLVIPKQHIASLDTAFPENGQPQAAQIGKMFEISVKIARAQGLLPGGYRSVINTGRDGGQTVFHLHLHLLGGKNLPGDL